MNKKKFIRASVLEEQSKFDRMIKILKKEIKKIKYVEKKRVEHGNQL
jgi:hypothetical protein